MSKKIGRNAPCPCGSGKKYKQCCLKKPSATNSAPSQEAGRGRFNPGSYGRSEFGFVPALLSELLIGSAWQPQFLLANPARPFDQWTEAAELATHDLDAAFAAKSTAGDEAAALKLDALGYKSVEDYRPEDFRSIEVTPGFAGGLEPALDPEEGAAAGEAFLNVVDEQIRIGEPEETALTFKRLVDGGHTEADAKRLIAMLIAAEIFDMTRENRNFDEGRYVKNLRRLPKLPRELR